MLDPITAFAAAQAAVKGVQAAIKLGKDELRFLVDLGLLKLRLLINLSLLKRCLLFGLIRLERLPHSLHLLLHLGWPADHARGSLPLLSVRARGALPMGPRARGARL